MTRWQKVILQGAIAVVVFDTVMSIASTVIGFSYTSASAGSFLIYFAVGLFAARATGLIRSGTLAGGIVGLVDTTLGWAISWALGAGVPPESEPSGFLVAGIVLVIISGTLGAALIGAFGGLIGRKMRSAPEPA